MLCFLGLRVNQPLNEKQKFKECLQEMRHYLSLKKADVTQSDYILTASNEAYSFSIPKNPLYLHTTFYNMPLFKSQDYDFLDTCYECLMIIQEAFPLNVTIQLVSDSESHELIAFQERKQDQLNRRINSNLRTLIQTPSQLTPQDVEIVIFLIEHHYTRKNKAIALKLLTTKISISNVTDLPQEFVEFIQRLQEEADLKKAASDLVGRIRNFQNQGQRDKENIMKMSNMSQNKYGDNIKLQPLIFQLKESFNLQRVCTLLANAINSEQDKDYFAKMESAVITITKKFLSNQFEEASRYGNDFGELLKKFWNKRGKKWDQSVRTSLQNKLRQLTLQSRVNTNKSRIFTSRKDN